MEPLDVVKRYRNVLYEMNSVAHINPVSFQIIVGCIEWHAWLICAGARKGFVGLVAIRIDRKPERGGRIVFVDRLAVDGGRAPIPKALCQTEST